MCESCDQYVATTGAYMDRVMEAEKRRRAKEPGESSAQHTIGLANLMLDVYNEENDKAQALANIALGAAVMVTRMLAAQEIHGVNFS
jgi:hypothetical protein